jgi:hypothetical protein
MPKSTLLFASRKWQRLDVKRRSKKVTTQILVLPKERESEKQGEAASSFTGPWSSCCDWLGRTVKGIAASMERLENDGTRVLEFQNWPLVAIRAHRLKNGVNAIGLTFAANNHERRFEITGVNAIHLERDAAGFPTVAEFVSETERVVVRFTEKARTTPIYTGNSWSQ